MSLAPSDKEKYLYHLAQLRHLYALMMNLKIHDTAEAARGLLAPAIECMEKIYDAEERTTRR